MAEVLIALVEVFEIIGGPVMDLGHRGRRPESGRTAFEAEGDDNLGAVGNESVW